MTAPTVGKYRVREAEKRRHWERESEKQTTVPSLTSLTPVAMPTTEREMERGGRASERVE